MPVFVYLPNYIISVKITVSDMHIMELLPGVHFPYWHFKNIKPLFSDLNLLK